MKNKYDQKYYDGNKQNGDRPALGFYARVFRKYLNKGKVLEFGAGYGYLSKRLSQYYQSETYDISEYSRKMISKVSPKSRILSSMTEAKINYYDGIISLHTLEHIKNPEETIRKLFEALKPKGVFFCVVPNPQGWGHSIKGREWFAYKDKTHVSLLNCQEWKEIIGDCGASIIKTSSDGFWDTPYLPFIPKWLQNLIFWPTAGLLILTNYLIYPEYFGEDLIIVARKTADS